MGSPLVLMMLSLGVMGSKALLHNMRAPQLSDPAMFYVHHEGFQPPAASHPIPLLLSVCWNADAWSDDGLWSPQHFGG